MGYEIYITRREHWSDVEGPSITEEEWGKILAEDPDFHTSPKDPLVAYITYPPGDTDCFGLNGDGQVSIKKPSRASLIKMAHIAKLLNARVMGDEDEIYDEKGMPDRPTQYIPWQPSYRIHITRRDCWNSHEGPSITEDEWRKVIEKDPELVPWIRPLYATLPLADPSLFGHCIEFGNIEVSQPSREELTKMLEIAKLLNARVIGDDGETYDENGIPDRPCWFEIRDSLNS